MSRFSLDRKRIWAAVLLTGTSVAASNYYLRLGLFGRYGIDILFFALFVSLLSLGYMLRSTDQVEDRGGSKTERGWSGTRHIVRRRLVDFNFLPMIVCFGLGLGWAKVMTYWGPGMSTWIRMLLLLPALLFVVAGFFFCMRGFWRIRS